MPGEQVAAAYAKISLDSAEFISGLRQAESRFKSFAGSIESTGSKLTGLLSTIGKGLTAEIAAAGAATLGGIKAFADYEKGLASVSKTTGLAGKELDALGESLRELSRQTPVTVTDLEKIASTAGSLGIGAQKIASGDLAGARAEIVEFTKTISDMAIAFDMSADTVAPMIGAIANVYKLPTNELALFGSQVNALENTMNATAPQILEFVNAFGGTASMFGESASKTAAFGAVLNSLGINGAEAATQLRSGILQLLQSYEVSESAVKKYAKEHNVSMEQAREALKINQKNVEKLAQVMGVSADEIRRRLNEDLYGSLVWIGTKLKDIQGDTEAAAIVSQIFGTYGYQAMMKLGASAETYDFALKQINTDSKGLERETAVMANTISGQWRRLKNNIYDVGIVVGKSVQGPVQDFLRFMNDKLIPGVRESLKALVSGDWAGAFTSLKNIASTTWESIKSSAAAVWDYIKNLDYKTIWDNIKGLALEAWDGIKSAASSIYDALKNVNWSSVWSAVKSSAVDVFNGLKSIILDVVNSLRNVDWGSVWNSLKSYASSAWNEVKSIATSALNTLSSYDWNKIFSGLASKATESWNSVKTIAIDVWNAISKEIERIDWKGIGDRIGGLLKKGFDAAAKINESLQSNVLDAINQGKFEDLGYKIGEKLVGGIKSILSKAEGGQGVWGIIKAVLGEAKQWFDLGTAAASDLAKGFAAAVAVPLFDAVVGPIMSAVSDILSRLSGLPVVGGKFQSWAEWLNQTKTETREKWLTFSKSVAAPGRSGGIITPEGVGYVITPTTGTTTSTSATGIQINERIYGEMYGSKIARAYTRTAGGQNVYVIDYIDQSGKVQSYTAPRNLKGIDEAIIEGMKRGLPPDVVASALGTSLSSAMQGNPQFQTTVRNLEYQRYAEIVESINKSVEESSKTVEDTTKEVSEIEKEAAKEEAKIEEESAEKSAKIEESTSIDAAQKQQNAAEDFAKKAMAAAEEYRQKTFAAGNSVVGAAQYAETSLKLGAEIGGKFMTNAGQAVVVSFDTATNTFKANVGSVGTSLKQTGDYNLMKAQEMGAVITNSGSNTSSKLLSGGMSAYTNLLSGGLSAMGYLQSGGATVYQKLASIPDIGVKIAVAADYLASRIISAANSLNSAANYILQSTRSFGTPIYRHPIYNYGFAEGGIVSSPIVGLIGEAGAEAIVPLKDRKAGWNVLRKILPLFGIRPFAEGGIIGAAEGSTGSETISASFQISYLDQAAAVFGSKLRYMLNYFRKTMDLIRLDSIKKWRDIIDSSTKVWNEFITSVSQKSIEFRMVVGKAFYDTATSLIATITAASIELSGRFDLMMTSFKESSQSTFNMLNSMFESFKNDILPAFINGWQSSLNTMVEMFSSTVTKITGFIQQIANALTQLTGRTYNINIGSTGGIGGGGGGGGGGYGSTTYTGGSQLFAENAFAEIGGICQVDISGMTPGLIQSLYLSGAWKPNEYPLSQQIYQSILGSLGQPSGGATGSAQNWSVFGNTVNYSNIASNVLSAATKGISKPASTSGAASSIWSAVTKTSSGLQIGSTSTKSVVKLGKYQHGGLALTPQIAMIAESGPEAIIPIEKLSKLSGEDNIIVNLYMDGHKISDAVMNRAARTLKSRGIKI